MKEVLLRFFVYVVSEMNLENQIKYEYSGCLNWEIARIKFGCYFQGASALSVNCFLFYRKGE